MFTRFVLFAAKNTVQEVELIVFNECIRFKEKTSVSPNCVFSFYTPAFADLMNAYTMTNTRLFD